MCESHDPDKEILTAKEVAKLLRVSESTISRYATSGKLKSYVFCEKGPRRFRESDVWAFFDNLEDRSFASAKEE